MNRYNSVLVVSALMFAAAAFALVGWRWGDASPAGQASLVSPRSSIVGAAGSSGSIANPQDVPVGQPRGISVTGEAKSTVAPDLALLNIGVESAEATVGRARERAAVAMEAIVSTLRSNGVEDRDIQTTYLNVMPDRRYNKPDGAETVVGYRVNHMVAVKVRNIHTISKVVDDAVIAGGDLARVHGIQFTVNDPNSLYAGLRRQAIEDARAKGEQLANASGVGLGGPIYISEGGAAFPVFRGPPGGKGGDGAQYSTPISPGENEIRLSVQVVYDISY